MMAQHRPAPRPSLKRSTLLADGRPAWPVAEKRGISEALFYSRLRSGMSPDDLVKMGVERRDPVRMAENRRRRAEWQAGQAAAKADAVAYWPPVFDLSHDDYSGVLASEGDVRLVVTLRGARYCLQDRQPDGWKARQQTISARSMIAYLGAVADPPLPQFEAVLARLPDDPWRCAQVPFGKVGRPASAADRRLPADRSRSGRARGAGKRRA